MLIVRTHEQRASEPPLQWNSMLLTTYWNKLMVMLIIIWEKEEWNQYQDKPSLTQILTIEKD
jgi:hypothetical protein